MPDNPPPSSMLPPATEVQAFLIALAESGDEATAKRQVRESLVRLGESLPETPEAALNRFYRLLISALLDQQPLARALLPERHRAPAGDPALVLPKLQALSPAGRHAYLLRRLTPLAIEQIADIVDRPPDEVRHPLWPRKGETGIVARRRYREQLRGLGRELALLRGRVTPPLRAWLGDARRTALAAPLPPEARALRHWQRALARQMLPTTLAIGLLLGLWLLGRLVL